MRQGSARSAFGAGRCGGWWKKGGNDLRAALKRALVVRDHLLRSLSHPFQIVRIAEELPQALCKALSTIHDTAAPGIQQQRRHFGAMVGMWSEQHRFSPDSRFQQVVPAYGQDRKSVV